MKKIQCGLIILGFGLMVGCANKPVVMPPLKYNKPIDFQVNKNAYLNWEVGKGYSGTVPLNRSAAFVVGGLVMSAVDSIDRNNNPSRYTLSYGKAEQIVFMTSLRDVLAQNHVFKQVELIADSQKIASKDVLINIFFKTARVASPERGYKITLSVEMSISTGEKAPFKRTYLVQSDTEGISAGFREQQIDVSDRLLEKVIYGIEEWHKMNNAGKK